MITPSQVSVSPSLEILPPELPAVDATPAQYQNWATSAGSLYGLQKPFNAIGEVMPIATSAVSMAYDEIARTVAVPLTQAEIAVRDAKFEMECNCEAAMQPVWTAIAAINKRIDDWLTEQLANLYNLLGQCGHMVPTDDQIKTYIESGDVSPMLPWLNPDIAVERPLQPEGTAVIPPMVPIDETIYVNPLIHFKLWPLVSDGIACESKDVQDAIVVSVRMLGLIKASNGDRTPISKYEYGQIIEAVKAGEVGLAWLPGYEQAVEAAMGSPAMGAYGGYEFQMPDPSTCNIGGGGSPIGLGGGKSGVGGGGNSQGGGGDGNEDGSTTPIGQSYQPNGSDDEIDGGTGGEEESEGTGTGGGSSGGTGTESKAKKKFGQIDAATFIKPPDWGSLDVCNIIKQIDANLGAGGTDLVKTLGFGNGDDDPKQMPAWFKIVYDGLPVLLDDAVYSIVTAGLKGMGDLANLLGSSSNCSMGGMVLPAALNFLLGFLNKQLGGGLEDVMQSYKRWLNYECPSDIPSAGEAVQAWLNGTISYELFECWIKANNLHIDPMAKVAQAARTKPNINEVIALYLRGMIDGPTKDRMAREAGCLTITETSLFEQLAQQLPGMSDLIRMMVRDIGDDAIVEKYGYAKGFEDKWNGKLVEWARAQGVSNEVALAYYLAHWELPSPTQLYEMLHRLRPGVVPDNVATDFNTIKEALQVNDIPDFWVERLMAISYRPLTRVDTRRAFNTYQLNEGQLLSAYQDEGYDINNAQILVNFAKNDRKQLERKKLGLRTLSMEKKAYLDGLLTEQQFVTRLQNMEYDFEQVRSIVADTNDSLNERVMRDRVKATEKLWKTGGLADADAVTQLMQEGVDGNNARRLLTEWAWSISKGPKEIATAKLCKWYKLKLIGAAEYYTRLVRVGNTSVDASRMVKECGIELDGENQKKLDAAKKKAETEQKAKDAAKAKADKEKKAKEKADAKSKKRK